MDPALERARRGGIVLRITLVAPTRTRLDFHRSRAGEARRSAHRARTRERDSARGTHQESSSMHRRLLSMPVE